MTHHVQCCILGICCPLEEQAAELAEQMCYGLGWDNERKEKYARKMAKWLLDNYDLAPKGTSAAIDTLYGAAFAEKYHPRPVSQVCMPQPTHAPLRVLIVEDDDTFAEHLKRLFERGDMPVALFRVETLAAAISALATNDYDLVLLDLSLPDSVGLDTIDIVMRAPIIPPVVVSTGGANEEQHREALRRGVQAYFDKGDISKSPPDEAARKLWTIALDAISRVQGVRAQYLALVRLLGRQVAE